MTELKGPLKGIKILDLTRLLPGPLATQYLADLGAEVIKIEDVDFPDYTRFFPPQLGSESVHFLSINRSKKSLCIKLGSKEGNDIFFDLVKTADIVIEGYRPGKVDEMGIGYTESKKINSGIIYVSITGYGQDGPLADKAGHDLNYIGYSGALAVSGKDGKVVMPGVQIADIMGGSYNCIIACLTAIIERSISKEGQLIDISMTDGALQMVSMPLGEFINTGTLYKAGEFMLSGGLANYNTYACQDGKYIALGTLEPKFWMGFCKMIERPEWMNRALPIGDYVKSLKQDLEDLFQTKTREEWMVLAQNFDVCISPVLNLDEIETHPYFVSRKMIVEHEHPKYGKIKSINQPLKFSRSILHNGWAAPILGEHTLEILNELGYSSEKIEALTVSKWIKISS
jgi:crotonobetainyl-CoA:carnitine CoA-transferase CaiB-like acyl-CoA transferase